MAVSVPDPPPLGEYVLSVVDGAMTWLPKEAMRGPRGFPGDRGMMGLTGKAGLKGRDGRNLAIKVVTETTAAEEIPDNELLNWVLSTGDDLYWTDGSDAVFSNEGT